MPLEKQSASPTNRSKPPVFYYYYYIFNEKEGFLLKKKQKKEEKRDSRENHLVHKSLPNPKPVREDQESWEMLRQETDFFFFYHFQRICTRTDEFEREA